MMNRAEQFKPAVSRRTLLLIAGCVWCLAGGSLTIRALKELIAIHQYLLLELGIGLVLGIGFYVALFAAISRKHIGRIERIAADRPCLFAFFNVRSYIMMVAMIAAGITLRRLHIVDPRLLFTFYLVMGIPLLIAASRFFRNWASSRPV